MNGHIREACRNAVTHGRPSELRVAVTVAEHLVTATVSDNGQGFSPGTPGKAAGGGLPSMAERVGLLNGVLRVRSEIGEGSTVTVRVPLPGGPAG